MNVEYRTWTAVPNVPFENEAAWTSLTSYLDEQQAAFGPVATWEDDLTTIVLVLASDEPDASSAAATALTVISDALRAVKLSDRVPRVLEVEPASDPLAA